MANLPIGEHYVCIVASELKRTKQGNGGFLALTLEAISGEHVGKAHTDRVNIVSARPIAELMGQKRLSEYCQAAGFPQAAFANATQLHFMPFIVRIAPQTKNPTYLEAKTLKACPQVELPAALEACEKRKALAATPPSQDERSQPPKVDRSLLVNGQAPAPQIPFGTFGAFGDWIETTAKAASAPLDYVAFALVTCAAALAGNARPVRPEPSRSNWEEPLAMWVSLVGPPSSGKTPALAPFNTVLRKMEADDASAFAPHRDAIEARREAAKGAESEWKAAVAAARKNGNPIPLKPQEAVIPPEAYSPRIVVRGATLEALIFVLQNNPNGLLQMNDELSTWLGDMSRYSASSDRPHWLSMYSGQPIVLDRVKYDGEPRRVEAALVSVLGGIQPDKLAELLKTPDDGLIARFLPIWPDARQLERSDAMPDMYLLQQAFERLHMLKAAPSPMYFSQDASDLFFEFRRMVRAKASHAEGVLAGWIGKGDGVVARLAGILTLLDWAHHGIGPSPMTVDKEAVQRAGDLWVHYLLPMARRTFGDAARPQTERAAIRLLKEIRSRGTYLVNGREIRREWKLPGLSEPKTVSEALAFLDEAGWVRASKPPTGGRPRDDWEVNPELFH